MSLDPETVGIAHAQAETQRQPHPIGQRAQSWTGGDGYVAARLASDRQQTGWIVDLVRAIDDAELVKDLIVQIARRDTDIVHEALDALGLIR